MTRGFEHQDSRTHHAFSRSAAQPHQVGVRVSETKKAKPAEPTPPKRPPEPRTF